MTWDDPQRAKNWPVNSRTLCRLSYTGSTGDNAGRIMNPASLGAWRLFAGA
jgi:hypothetical protein